jgi:hypothetical protein
MTEFSVRITVHDKGCRAFTTFYLGRDAHRTDKASDAGVFGTVTKAMSIFGEFLTEFNNTHRGNMVVTTVEAFTVKTITTII